MEKLKFTVEKNKDGYWAYRQEPDGLVSAYGEDLPALKADIVKAYNFFYEEHAAQQITEDAVQLSMDLSSFFNLYSGVVAAAGIGKRAGVQKTAISAYVNGAKKPSETQIAKLLNEVNKLGRELADIEIAG